MRKQSGQRQAMLPDEEISKQERAILSKSDSQTLKQALAAADDLGWMNRNLWAGLVPYYGSSADDATRVSARSCRSASSSTSALA